MPAYVINDMEITDPQRFEEYKRLSPATVAAYGGRFLARGGAVSTMEGVRPLFQISSPCSSTPGAPLNFTSSCQGVTQAGAGISTARPRTRTCRVRNWG